MLFDYFTRPQTFYLGLNLTKIVTTKQQKKVSVKSSQSHDLNKAIIYPNREIIPLI